MNAINGGNDFPQYHATLARAFVIAGLLSASALTALAVGVPSPGDTNSSPTYTALDSWSFQDSTNWTSDKGYAPLSFTNLSFSYLGDGASLTVDTNLPAWLQYNVVEADGATNFSPTIGTVCFWFAPSSWASTNIGGTGPGEYGRLIEAGGYTPDSSYGLWSLYVDDVGQNIYFSAQTNDLSSNLTTYITAPISWTNNYFHFIVLTYSPTNTALFIDGSLITNGPGLTIYPGPDVLANGFFIGSDSNGVYQANGMFNSVATYDTPMDSDTIQNMFWYGYNWYMISPLNVSMWITSAPSSQTNFIPNTDVITGTGNLINIGSAPCLGYNTNVVWITGVTATKSVNGTLTVTFGIEGGTNGVFYDVFANSLLDFSSNTNKAWAWMGQAQTCQMYQLTNLPNTTCYLILGTPQDSDGDGLTDAYETLVSKSNPNGYTTDASGMADGWEVLYFGHTGIDPNGDPDGDGLTTFQEWLMNSKSYNPAKWNSFTSVGDGYQDYSGDGLANLLAPAFGGNLMTNNVAWRVNASGDGLPDEYKTLIGLNTNSAQPAPMLPAYSKNPIQ